MCEKQQFLTCLWCETQIFCAFYFQDAELRVPSTYSEEAKIETDGNFIIKIKWPKCISPDSTIKNSDVAIYCACHTTQLCEDNSELSCKRS